MGFGDRIRILVVDDEPSICRALTIALSRGGYDVRAVESGERAHTLVRTEHFDCLVLDLRIPDMRGDVLFELAASIQPQLRTRTIFTTGDTSERASSSSALATARSSLGPSTCPSSPTWCAP